MEEIRNLRTLLDQLVENATWPALTLNLPDEMLGELTGEP